MGGVSPGIWEIWLFFHHHQSQNNWKPCFDFIMCEGLAEDLNSCNNRLFSAPPPPTRRCEVRTRPSPPTTMWEKFWWSNLTIQGGSDISGILKRFIKNYTAQLKMIRFYWGKKYSTEECLENSFIQWNRRQQQWRARSWSKISCRPSPRCPCRGTPSPPRSSCSGPLFCFEALRWPLTQIRHT